MTHKADGHALGPCPGRPYGAHGAPQSFPESKKERKGATRYAPLPASLLVAPFRSLFAENPFVIAPFRSLLLPYTGEEARPSFQRDSGHYARLGSPPGQQEISANIMALTANLTAFSRNSWSPTGLGHFGPCFLYRIDSQRFWQNLQRLEAVKSRIAGDFWH